jgi:uncharacterized protein
MKISGEYLVLTRRAKVWAALNDPVVLGPVVLKESIPGCESLEKLSDTPMAATVKTKLGPVSATFMGKMLLSNLDPPNGFTISGEGKVGTAGFAREALT